MIRLVIYFGDTCGGTFGDILWRYPLVISFGDTFSDTFGDFFGDILL